MKTILTFLLVCFAAGCSTAGTFVLPQGTTLAIAGHAATADNSHPGMLNTRAFSWGSSGGASYELTDASGQVVRSGKLATHFRMGSLFFPPIAGVFVVPMGLRRDVVYDLSAPADGKGVLK